jgi:serine/alanine adding enzyme
MGYEFEDHLNFLVDLTKSKEELWANLSKSRRRFIRKAREKGVTIEEITNRNLISPFYDLLQQTYKNANIPLVDVSLFESAFDIFKKQFGGKLLNYGLYKKYMYLSR